MNKKLTFQAVTGEFVEKELILGRITSRRRVGITNIGDRLEGFGNVIIPSDIDRSKYLAMVYRQGECMIVSDYGDVLKQVKIPRHILQQLSFPQSTDQRGTLIEWKRHAFNGTITILAIHPSPGEFPSFNEYVWSTVRSKDQYSYSTTIDLNSKVVSNVLKSPDDSGKVVHKASGSSNAYIELLCSGVTNIVADDKVTVTAENSVIVKVGSAENQISVLEIAKDGTLSYKDQYGNEITVIEGKVQVKSKSIFLGDKPTDFAVLGNTLVEILTQLCAALAALTVTCSSPGSPSSPPINAATFIEISGKLSTILSKITKLQ